MNSILDPKKHIEKDQQNGQFAGLFETFLQNLHIVNYLFTNIY